ncbi:MAG: hypothetical protein KDB01_09295 [Planctomycetaceae bacterium]|nr:hypothetical protein [Planctomycetaceae bacterium]
MPSGPACGDEKSTVASVAEQEQRIAKINEELSISLNAELKARMRIDPKAADAVNQYSSRGDLLMFLGEFERAETDYVEMVRLKPELDASHWRLGIAMFFAGHPQQAAQQFDKYNSFDNVDRENGIWRYLSHYRAFGREEARRQLLRYEKDDRPPFKEVYQLFDGGLTADDVLKAIPDDPAATDRDARLFYSHLYIGMNQVVEGKTEAAQASLRSATLNPWPRKAGFGPNYMWHVARLQYLGLQNGQ